MRIGGEAYIALSGNHFIAVPFYQITKNFTFSGSKMDGFVFHDMNGRHYGLSKVIDQIRPFLVNFISANG